MIVDMRDEMKLLRKSVNKLNAAKTPSADVDDEDSENGYEEKQRRKRKSRKKRKARDSKRGSNLVDSDYKLI